PPPAPMRKKIVLRGVNFDYDKATLQPAGRPILDEAAEILKANPDVNVEVRGFTDSRGSDAYNMRLSERRAQTVKNYLVSRGVSPSRLTTRGYGESDPVATNETDSGRAQNRRVELIPQ
ncbi:OmpA family protein, partial [bacterium]|nr:OmpA family protein [bacterium]